MNNLEILEIIVILGTLTLLTPVLGGFMAKVFTGEKTFLHRVLRPLESLVYRLLCIDEMKEMNWKEYTLAIVALNALGFAFLFFLQLAQGHLPLNPANLSGTSWHLAFNTAVSFMTNTNWQAYAGETTMSYFTQMAGFGVQNFLSAATGIAVLLAFIRGLTRKNTADLGNAWVDLTRSVIYVLLPLATILTLLLVQQGVVQNFDGPTPVMTLEGIEQRIPQGPAASQIAIKQLGTNGGGYFNANSAHPLENPTPFSNFLQMLAILLIPASLTYTFGIMVGKRRQGWMIFIAMMLMLLAALAAGLWAEHSPNPVMGTAAAMEGKETRFGVTNSVMWAIFTTAASNGSVNAMHASLSPLTGGIAMFNIMLGEVIFGGVGCGLYGMLLFAILTVFLAGLMVGRTPEYLGKKIEAKDIQWTMIGILAPGVMILIGAGISVILPVALSSLSHPGPHGLSEILYAFSSAAGNNGSAFAGLNANTPFYNFTLGFAMLVGRFAVMIPALIVAGNLVQKKISQPSPGTFPTDTGLFVLLLIGVIAIVGGLTFFPALSLGPIVEHFLMLQGRTF